MSDPIRETATALWRAGLIHQHDSEEAIRVIKRKLEKAVPAKALVVYEGRDSRTVGEINGHNECRKLMGLE